MIVLYMSYYVAPGNWTTATIAGIGEQSNPQYLYSINPSDSTSGEPAVGCNKSFTANYKCGDSTTEKSITVPAEARSRNATFECTTEFNKCNKLQLHLADNGALTLVNSDAPTTILWTSTPPVIVNAVALPKYLPSVDTSPTGNFAKGRSYLKSNEFLSNGQWLSSPGGFCRLEMIVDVSNTLQVVYEALACNTINDLNAQSALLYTIPSGNNANVGKIGYVNGRGQLQLYPDAMTYYDESSYDLIGNYDIADAQPISTNTSISSLTDCKTRCSDTNDISSSGGSGNQCIGIVYGSGMCKLLDKTAFPVGSSSVTGVGKRTNKPNYELYMRTKNINPDTINESCRIDISKTIQGVSSKWNEYDLSSNMTATTTCGLTKYTEKEFEKTALSDASLNSLTSNANTFISGLLTKYNMLKDNLFNNKTKLDDATNELQESRKNVADWSGDQLEQLEAMKEDRDLNMMSQNYKHILWSILAIIIIIAVIYFTKSFAPAIADASTNVAASVNVPVAVT